MAELSYFKDLYGTRLILELVKEESESKIIKPESAQFDAMKGKVVKVGEGVASLSTAIKDVQVDDIVLFERRFSTPLSLDGIMYVMLDASKNVVGLVRKHEPIVVSNGEGV